MTIAKTPDNPAGKPTEVEFMAKREVDAKGVNKKQSSLRIPPKMIERIDRAAARLGISRSAFMVQSAARELERMGE